MATTKVFNMAGGKHSAEAYSSFEGLLYGSCVASGLTVTKSSSNMNCSIDSGAGLIKVGSTYARRIAIEGGALTVTVSAASTTLARRDTIVLYVDNSVAPTTSVEDNTNNILKGMVVAGTPAQSPSAPSATTIQNAVGAGNPYIILYDILVPANATNLSTATLYDRRVMAAKALIDNLPNGSITNQKIANATIALSKIDFSTATILTGNTPSIELTAGHWLIFASATVLSNVESGSFASDISWLGITKDFQGYRVNGENRPSSDISFFAERTINATTTYTCTATTGAQVYQENWLAIKLG